MVKTKSGLRKHVPLRTCIACRGVQGKRQLMRVVRGPDGTVKLDPTGKVSGRGAYVCHDRSCWKTALEGRKLAAALKTAIGAEDLAALRQFAAGLPETPSPDA